MTPILQYWEMPPGRWLEDASDILKEQGLAERGALSADNTVVCLRYYRIFIPMTPIAVLGISPWSLARGGVQHPQGTRHECRQHCCMCLLLYNLHSDDTHIAVLGNAPWSLARGCL